jgi:hypothetical protein
MSDYTAESIRILEPAEVEERFGWAQAAALAERYRRPEPWIRRGLEACRRAGVEADYFVERYLRKRRDIPRNPAVEECMRELLAEESRS